MPLLRPLSSSPSPSPRQQPPDEDTLDTWLKASRIVAGGVAFFLVLSGSQFIQGRLLGISAASPVLAPAAGLLTVGLGSITASLAADQAPLTLSSLFEVTRDGKKAAVDVATRGGPAFWVSPLDTQERTLRAMRTALLGIVAFKCLGGRFNAIAPSDVCRPGAFFRWRGTLKAGMEYASPLQKRRIDTYGLLYGCHTCGKRQIGDYIGDHMPPKKVAAQMSRRWWRRLLSIRVKQRFTPQCRPCSNLQSSAVRNHYYKDRQQKRVLVYHYTSLRRYHATGGVAEMARLFVGDETVDQTFRTILTRAGALLGLPLPAAWEGEDDEHLERRYK